MRSFFSKRAVIMTVLAASVFALLATAASSHEKPRILAIGGAVTEIVYALGKGDLLVARDSTSLYPEQARSLPDVGYMRQLSPEGVLSVNPTSVLMIEGSGPQQTIDVLNKSSIPVTTIPEGYDREAVSRKILAVGAAIDAQDDAKILAEKVLNEIDAAAAKASSVAEDRRKRVLFILAMQNGKIMAAGDHTAANGLLKLAGATNVAVGYQGYKPLNDEAIINAQPDVILILNNGESGASDDDVLKHPGIKLTPAGTNKAILHIDGGLLGFGPRTSAAIQTLNEKLYGG